ncbi:MAG: hypothetical protein ACOCUT_01135 [bacterium]
MKKNIASTIMESFKGVIPADKASEVEKAINEFAIQLDERYKVEYEKTLEESYKEWDNQIKEVQKEAKEKLQESESVAYQGYDEAKQMLLEKEAEIKRQKEEFENFLEEQYAVAKKMLDEEKARNDEIEQSLYESYNQQLTDIQDDLVNKIDEFLSGKIDVLAESVRKELKNSPEILESKVAFQKIKNIIAENMDAEEVSGKTNDRIEKLEETVASIQSENKSLKAKNMRLVTENSNFRKEIENINESKKTNEQLIDESTRKDAERRVAERIAENAEGRGSVVSKEDLIIEGAADDAQKGSSKNVNESSKNLGFEDPSYMRKLAGLK